MKHNTGISCIELGAGANTQVVPKAPDPEPPEGFIDNTVRVYKMVDGEKVLIRTEDPFQPGWDTPQRKMSGFGRKQEEDDNMARYDWEILWPQVQELLAAGKDVKDVASELEIDLSVLKSKVYRAEKTAEKQPTNKKEAPSKVTLAMAWDKHKTINGVAKSLNVGWGTARKWLQEAGINVQIKGYPGMTINPEFEAAVQAAEEAAEKQIKHTIIEADPDRAFIKTTEKDKQQTPDPEPEKVGRQDPVQEQEAPAADSVPEGVAPVNMPIGCELPKEETQYTLDDDEPIPYSVVQAFDLAPIKIQLICTALAEYKDEQLPADVALELVRAIGDISLEVR